MADIVSPFEVLSHPASLTIGIALIVLSTSILITHTSPIPSTVSRRERVIVALAFATAGYFGIVGSQLLREAFSFVALLYVVLFPILVGYLGFRELVIKGVYFDA